MKYIQQTYMCLRILGESEPIDFQKIIEEIPIVPDNILKKGENITFRNGKKSKQKAQNDVIIYEFKAKNGEDFYDTIRRKIRDFLQYKKYIRLIRNRYYISLRLSLTSDYAQMYFELPIDIIENINELGINLELSILSFGEALATNLSIWDKLTSKYRKICRLNAFSKYGRN